MAQIDVEQALSSARSRPAGTPPLSAVDLQIETAATTRFGSFADPRLEQTYRFEVIAPKLQVGATRAAIVGLVGIFVQLVFRLGNLVPISSPRVWISLLNAALCGAIIMGMRLARYINMNQRIWFEEVVLLLAASLVFILLQLPERLESLLEGTPPLSLCAPTFRFLLAAFLLGIFTPLRPPLYAFLALVGFAAAAIAEMMVGQRDMIGLFWSFGLTCTIVAGRHRIMSIERSQWYFHRSVKEAVVAREIKEREREAQKVQLARVEAGKEARSRLIRFVMHDLRSPLLSVHSIAMSLQELPRSTCMEDSRVSEGLMMLRSCSTMMQAVVSDMLDFERIDGGQLSLSLRPCSLADVISSTAKLFDEMARFKGVELVVAPLPPELQALSVYADANRLKQCLSNGVSNALKFTPEGGTIWIRATASVADAPADDEEESAARKSDSDSLMTADAADAKQQEPSGRGWWARSLRSQPSTSPHSQPPQTMRPQRIQRSSSDGANASRPQQGSAAVTPRFSAGASLFVRRLGAQRQPARGGSTAEYKREAGVWWRACITVADNGCGLDAGELAVLQQGKLFAQVGKGQLQGNGGTGLGLGIVRELLQQHSGSVLSITSAGLGQGTQFEMQLNLQQAEPPEDETEALPPQQAAAAPPSPRADELPAPFATAVRGTDERASFEFPPCAESAADPAQAFAPPPGHGTLSERLARPPEVERHSLSDGARPPPSLERQPLCVLHVEDDKILRKAMTYSILNKLGVPYTQVDDGQEALDLVLPDLHRFGICLMDNQMPHMTGAEAARRMRAAGYTGLIIGMTGDPSGCLERDEFERSGLDMCFNKDPVGLKAILKKIQEVLAAHRSGAEPGDARELCHCHGTNCGGGGTTGS